MVANSSKICPLQDEFRFQKEPFLGKDLLDEGH